MSKIVNDDASYRKPWGGFSRYRSVFGLIVAFVAVSAIVVVGIIILFCEPCLQRIASALGSPTPVARQPESPTWTNLQAKASISAALIAAWVAVVLRLNERITVRLGTSTIALFHVTATCRAMVAMDIPKQFVSLLDTPEPSGFADQARDEDYLGFFDNASDAIAELDRQTIARLTEFSVYLKIARDATRSMARWSDKPCSELGEPELGRRRNDVRAIIYALFLTFEAADACVARLGTRQERDFLERLLGPSLVLLQRTLADHYEAQDDKERKALLTMPRRRDRMKQLKELNDHLKFG